MTAIPLFWLNITIASALTSLSVPPPPPPVDLLFVGDIMLGRYVETLMDKSGEDYPFLKVDDMLMGHDIVVGNLEGPIPTVHRQTANNVMVFSFKESTANLLKKHYFTDIMLANNHTFDQGEANFLHTVDVVEAVGLGVIGHPTAVDENYVLQKEINGKSLLFVGFHDATRRVDDVAARALLEKVAAEDPDYLVVTIHWGNEYQLTSGTRQQELAHMFIDAGADVIIGHHPHVTQEIEVYNNKLIFYSLGNFIFDQYFSTDTEEGLAVAIELHNDTVRYTLLPIESQMSQPSLMNQANVSRWLESLAERSSPALKDQILEGVIETSIVY